MSKVLGLDVGDSKIGVAMSDALGWIAQGVTTFRRKNMQQDLRYLRKLIHDNDIKEVVVGLPMKKNGTTDAQTRKILRFANIFVLVNNMLDAYIIHIRFAYSLGESPGIGNP